LAERQGFGKGMSNPSPASEPGRRRMAIERATYTRIRAAVSAAHSHRTVTALSGSTELSLHAAAEYAAEHMAFERIRDVVAAVHDRVLEIAPVGDGSATGAAQQGRPAGVERRSTRDRRSGRDRRKPPQS
jgi:hypothetical protein